jgi:hypothetical protein
VEFTDPTDTYERETYGWGDVNFDGSGHLIVNDSGKNTLILFKRTNSKDSEARAEKPG